MQEPFQMPIPFGLAGDSNLPVATDMRTSEASFTIPVQEETMETQELDDAFRSVEIKLGELVDAKRPLASTLEMPKDEAMLTNTPATEEPVVQAVKEPVVQSVKKPVVKAVKEPEVQSVKEPVVQAVKEPVVQSVKEPASAPLKEQTMPPPLVKSELLQSTKPSALSYSEHFQRINGRET